MGRTVKRVNALKKASPGQIMVLSDGTRLYTKIYNRILDMRKDYLDGMSKSEMRKAYIEGKYAGLENCNNDESIRSAWQRDWRRLLAIFKDDFENSREILTADFMGKYSHLYKEAMRKNNLKEARAVLDSMAKIAGIYDVAQQTNVQINTKDEGVTVNFGFDNNESSVQDKSDKETEGGI